jgi:hypothetical protein
LHAAGVGGGVGLAARGVSILALLRYVALSSEEETLVEEDRRVECDARGRGEGGAAQEKSDEGGSVHLDGGETMWLKRTDLSGRSFDLSLKVLSWNKLDVMKYVISSSSRILFMSFHPLHGDALLLGSLDVDIVRPGMVLGIQGRNLRRRTCFCIDRFCRVDLCKAAPQEH